MSVVRELERYGRYAESVATPIDIADVMGEVGSSGEVSRLRRMELHPRRRGFVVAVATVLTLLIVGGLALLAGFGRETDVVEPTPVTTLPSPEGVEEPFVVAETTAVEFLTWVPVLDPDFEVVGRIDALEATVAGWTAVGSVTSAETDGWVPAVWTSADGIEWVRVQSPALELAPGGATALVDHSGRIVVVGHLSSTNGAVIWYSDGGTDWVSVDLPDTASDSTRVHAAAVPVSNAGFVVVGTDTWFSPDAKAWTRSELEGGEAFALAVFDSGLIAAGESDVTGHAAVWMSDDIGTSWAQMTVNSRPDLFESSVIGAVAATGDGFVAVGAVFDNGLARPAAWKSDAGESWDLVWVGFGASGILEGLSHSGEQLIAVGTDPAGMATGTVWQSADFGNTWDEYVDRTGLFASALDAPGAGIHAIQATDGGVVVAVGERDGSPAIWVGGPAEALPKSEESADEDAGWTCQARIDNGAVWSLGSWDEVGGAYSAESPLACLDLLDAHRDPQQWKVVWEGSASNLEVGLLIVFEKGIHGEVYAEFEAETESGEWVTPVLTPNSGPFTFVVMPHSFDTWEELTFTVIPCSSGDCR